METLTYSAIDLPDWLSISETGLITGTPLNDDVGTHNITVRVKDLGGLSDDQQFTPMVNNTNDAPLMNIISDQSIDEDQTFSYQLGAYDIDSEVVQETLTYSAIDLPDC